MATVFVATASLTQSTATFSRTSGLYLPNFLGLITGPKATWFEVVTDVIATTSYFAIFGCIFWVLIKLRRLPQIREYRWIFYCFAAFVVARGTGRLIKVMMDWWPDDYIWSAIRLVIAAVSAVTAACFAFTSSEIAKNIRAFVDRYSTTAEEKELALLALSASETQTIAVRTQAAMDLAETTDRFQLLVEGVREHALFTVNFNGDITSWNRGAEHLLGYPESEMIGRHFSCMLTAEDREKGMHDILIGRAQRSRQCSDEGWRVRANGERFWAEVSKTALLEPNGAVSGFAVIMHDLTSKRGAELEIRDSARRMKAVVDSAMDGLITIDERGIVDSFNPACERIFGYSAAEVIGQNIKVLMPEPYHSEHDRYLADYAATGHAHIIGTPGRELTGKRKDGWLFPMDLSVSGFELEGGRYYSGIIRDITERKKTELALVEASRSFRLLVEGVHDHALFTVDLRGNVTSWNQGAQRLLGYTEAEILHCSFGRLFTREDLDARIPEIQMQKALIDGQAEDEGWRLRADGERFWADVNKTLLKESSGTLLGFAVMMRDVTERKKVATALEEARQERERLQESFLSHVSHELRTPLTAIYFFLTNVIDGIFGELNTDQAEQISLALENTAQLKNMVSDLLDITRVQTHKLSVASQPTSPEKLVAEVINTCQTTASEKRIRLVAEIPGNLSFVWADPARVRQILTNLVDNGIKFTPEEGVITVGHVLPAEDDGFLCLYVKDTGCGISPANCEIIFDRLAQVKSNTDASRSGLGLGLFITRELVVRHGGRIWLESTLGEGSTFYFTLPIFSLQRWCNHVFSMQDPPPASMTVIAADLATYDGALLNDNLHDIKRALERCIQPGQDVILPTVEYSGYAATIFIVACTGPVGVAVIENRIQREIQISVNISRFKPIITSTTVDLPPGAPPQEQIARVTARIERLIEEHLATKETVK